MTRRKTSSDGLGRWLTRHDQKKGHRLTACGGQGMKLVLSTSYATAWVTCKRVGDEAEQRVARWLQRSGWKVHQLRGHAPFDLLATRQIRIEVKADQIAHRTGRVAFELRSRGKPSGLATCQADLWVHAVSEQLALAFPPRQMLLWVKSQLQLCELEMMMVGEQAEVVLIELSVLQSLPFVELVRLDEAADGHIASPGFLVPFGLRSKKRHGPSRVGPVCRGGGEASCARSMDASRPSARQTRTPMRRALLARMPTTHDPQDGGLGPTQRGERAGLAEPEQR